MQYLALRKEVCHQRSPDCILEITILKDDQWGFPTELQSHWLHTFGGQFHNLEASQLYLDQIFVIFEHS